jgi:hypothetical protein
VAVRLLDPRVLAQVPEGHNCSGAQAAAAPRFEHVWERASNISHLPFGPRQQQLRMLWKEMLADGEVAAAFGVEPLCAYARCPHSIHPTMHVDNIISVSRHRSLKP